MKIKLIYPPGWYRYNTVLLTGITTLSSYLRMHGYETSLSDLELDTYVYNKKIKKPRLHIEKMCFGLSKSLEEISTRQKKILINLAKIDDCDVIGISIMGRVQFMAGLVIAEKAKALDKIVVMGGEGAYHFADWLMGDDPRYVDFILHTDAWEPFRILLEKIKKNETNYEKIPNLIYKQNGKIIKTPRVEFPIENMPKPDFSDLNFKDYLFRQRQVYKTNSNNLIMQYIANLGCINNCVYCGRPGQHGFDTKSPDKIVSEIYEMCKQTGSTACKIEGNELNPTKKYLNDLAEQFTKRKKLINWSGYLRLDDRVDEQTLINMKNAGCLFIRWGIESGAQNFHDRMRKGYTVDRLEKILNDSARAGLFNLCIFMVGTPGETDEEIETTGKFILKNKKNIHAAKINLFHINEDSDMYKCPEKFNITINEKYPGGFCENEKLDWYQCNKIVSRRTDRLVTVLVKAGLGQSGHSSDLIFSALLENDGDRDKTIEWLKKNHPKLFTEIPTFMAPWYIYHRDQEPLKGTREQQYFHSLENNR